MQKHSSKTRLNKQQGYNLHWNISSKQRQYNALTDPHAIYYFVSKVAKQRLKQLKQSLRKEKKSPHNKQIIKLINQRIKCQLPKLKLPLLQGSSIQDRQINQEKRKFSEQFHHKILTQRGRQMSNKSSFKNLPNQFEQENQTLQKLKKSHQIKHKKSHKKIKPQKTERHQKKEVNHQQFLQFLSKKKQQITFLEEKQLN